MAFLRYLKTKIVRLIFSSLFKTSYFLLGGPIVSAAAGFAYWTLAARLVNPAAVGIIAASISASNLLNTISDFGLSPALLHYATKNEEDTPGTVNAVIAAGWFFSSISVFIFIGGMPFWAPNLLPLRNDQLLILTFVLFTVVNYILGLQDMIMLSRSKASFVFWRNLFCNGPMPFLLFALVPWISENRSLAFAYTSPNIIVGVLSGLFVLPRVYTGYQLFGCFRWRFFSEIASYAIPNYISNVIWGTISYAIPLIVINSLSAEATSYFYICWTLFNFVLIIPRSVNSALFVEGSLSPSNYYNKAFEAFILIASLALPAIIILWFFGQYLLGIFGKAYVNISLLRLLLLSVIPFAINSIFFMILRLRKKLLLIVLFSSFVLVSVYFFIKLLIPSLGLNGIALGWLLGHLLPSTFVIFLILFNLFRKKAPISEIAEPGLLED